MRRRWTITVAALAAVATALAACGGGAEPASTTTATQDEAPAVETSAPPTVAGTAPETETETEAQAGTETTGGGETGTGGGEDIGAKADAVIRIESGEPVGGVATVTVKKGDDVRIVVRADAEDELHLHGYDITKAVGPGRPAIFAFEAEFEGIFELESHHAGTLVAKVVVEP